MTAWTTPRTWNIGELVSKIIMDTHIRDNLLHLKEQISLSRQGGSATDWSTQGTTDYAPSSIRMQAGVKAVPTVNTATGSKFNGTVSVTFPQAFGNKPLIFLSVETGNSSKLYTVTPTSINTTGFSILIVSDTSTTNIDVAWLAVGER